MVRRVTFVLLWVLATLVATGVGLAAVRSVAGQVVDGPDSELLGLPTTTTTVVDHSLLAAAANAAASAEAPTEPEDLLEVTTPTEVPQERSPESETDSAAAAEPAPQPASEPAPANAPAPAPEEQVVEPVAEALPEAEAAAVEAATDAPKQGKAKKEKKKPPTTPPPVAKRPPEVSEATHQLDGGWVRITFVEGVVKLDAAGPVPGFTMIISDTGPEEVSIAFRGRNHQSRLRAAWQEGELEVDVVEAKRRG